MMSNSFLLYRNIITSNDKVNNMMFFVNEEVE